MRVSTELHRNKEWGNWPGRLIPPILYDDMGTVAAFDKGTG